MIGKPKYNYGDIVKFKYRNDTKTGVIAIIDYYGTFYNDKDVSYDILNKDENILYKHFEEKYVIEKIGEIDPEKIWDR